MITEKDLQEAIAECEGERNPNANTCIKLASFYTIRDQLFPRQPDISYSYQPPTQTVKYNSDSEFSQVVNSLNTEDVMKVMDELMTTLEIVNPRLYNGTMRRLKGGV